MNSHAKALYTIKMIQRVIRAVERNYNSFKTDNIKYMLAKYQ